MAYIDQETKKQVAPAIKAVLQKYGMKGSIAIRNHSTLVVNIKSGKLDIMGNWCDQNKPVTRPTSLDVNVYWIDTHYTGKVRDFLNELVAAMKIPSWKDDSDIQTDYFNTTYYNDINVGNWNKPYILEK